MRKLDRSTVGFWAVAILFVVGIQVLISAGILSNFWSTLLKLGGVMAIVSLGLNLIYGFNGQFSLGQFGFYAIGAYASADITYRWDQLHSADGVVVLTMAVSLVGLALLLTTNLLGRIRGLDTLSSFGLHLIAVVAVVYLSIALSRPLIAPVTGLFAAMPENLALNIVFFMAILVSGVLAAEISYLFGLPVLTLGSDYFGIATLGFTIIVKVLLDNSDTMLGFEEMKGARGMVGIPKATTWIWVAVALFLIIAIVRNLLHSSHGRALISVREDEIAAKAMGIDVAQQKIFAFVLGSLFSGVAGALYAHINGFLHPNTFNFIKAFDPMIVVVFGGLGGVTGNIFAAFAWALILEGFLRIWLPDGFETWRFVVYPILLLIMMLLRPSGIFGSFEVPFIKRVLPPLPASLTGKSANAQPASSQAGGSKGGQS
ncbi:MAG TPA: branched-chain amino acid ABC transporter permease [Anaerolineales bacterium]|nr:branched-chain amino acid ABC transporter permease [Anaerolineales bacterium]